MKKHWIILVLCILLFVVVITLALADGTETLGPPSIPIPNDPIAPGNGMVAAGTGMVTQPGTIEFSVPDDVPNDVTIKQVVLYWEGRMTDDEPGDNTIVVNGTEVTGELIGGQTLFCEECFSSSFRADITNLGLVTSGDNTLTLSGLGFTLINDGAGVLVLYKDSGLDAEIELFDGIDVAFQNWPEPRKSTEPQTFTFKASTEERQAQLSMFFASIGRNSDGSARPHSIEVTSGGITEVYSNPLGNNDGDEWDTLNLEITIPKNDDNLTVQVFSRDDEDTGNLPASLAWIVAGLMVPPGNTHPEVEISKICTPAVFVGDEIEYEITVSNTGDENLTDLVVIDPLLELEVEIDSLAIGASSTVTDSMIAAEASVITNTVTVTATGEISTREVSDADSCTTNVYELEVTKDAQTSLTRRYNWKINKTVNEKKSINLTLFPTQVVAPTYDVAVRLGYPAYLDSDWVVSGTISITNPAPVDASLESVTDVISDLDMFHQYLPVVSKSGESQSVGVDQNQLNHITLPGISAPVSCPSLTVPAGETLVCTYGPVDLLSGSTRTNTAFAALKNRRGGVFSGTTVFSGTAQVDLTSADIELIDEEVTVNDQRNGEDDSRILGTANVNELPKSFVYKLGLPSFSTEECSSMELDKRTKQVPNTATFITNDTKTSGSSSAIVNLFCFVSASTGFEDLPLDEKSEACKVDPSKCNDWDYNDAFFEVSFDDPLPTFSGDDLKEITFQFVQPNQCSVNTHEFHIQPPFVCDGTYSLTRITYPKPEGDKKIEVINETYKKGQDLTIFDDTDINYPPDDEVYCPPETSRPPETSPPQPNTAELVINFDVSSPGACPLDLSEFDPFETFNGEGLFYVPSLVVKAPSDKPETWPEFWYTIKPNAENPETRIVGVPDTWKWPKENQCIWAVYPDIEPMTHPKGPPDFTPFWWGTDKYTGPNETKCFPWGPWGAPEANQN